ncbi:SOS response-associated peptidase [Roseovarius sp. PS-C2]|uniref:SOS response-associated peptidase n=1 Tax=Roseovarius sp. PS-C2 TaxID=2820814 RepID=UPI00346112D0
MRFLPEDAMCGRFIEPELAGTDQEHSETKIDPFPGRPVIIPPRGPRRYNVAPTQDILIIGGEPLAAMTARWWLIPSWHQGSVSDWKATTFNARIEDARIKPTFRAVWRRGRCLIPAGGYYEWTGEKGAKVPHVVLPGGNDSVMWFAGLASRWNDLLTCTIMTRAATDTVSDIHHRMPVILDLEERETWLSGSDEVDTLGEAARLQHHPVHSFGIRDDGPELIEPV